jgi:hypothetical protein
VGLKVNGAHQLPVYDDLNMLEDNIDNMNEIIETLIDACEEVHLKVNEEKIKYRHMLMYRDQNSEQNQTIKLANIYFENVPIFRYLGKRLTDQNLIHLEIKSRF